ncbi:MAG: double-strand break repair protein AddB [Parvularculaceae bacterium]
MSRAPGLFAAPAPRVYSIDAGRPFLSDLADALKEEIADPFRLAASQIFVPTRRAASALAEAFAQGGPSLLPRIKALGDVDEDELFLGADAGADDADIAPAVSDVERRLVLARFISAAEEQFPGQASWAAALAAAEEVAGLLDSLYTEEIDFARLRTLAPVDHAEHWAVLLKFLKVVTDVWPAYLGAQGLEDPARRRALLIDAQGDRFAMSPPAAPIVIAGTTGSVPAVARLMKIVARLPEGAVVLPGLDRALCADARGWELMDDGHPQAGVRAALAAIGVAPGKVRFWPRSGEPAPRLNMISLALRPAAATDDWLALVGRATKDDPHFAAALKGVSFVEAPHEEAEAAAIALLFREALETARLTAMLVTPDRGLGRRVAARMRRWGVIVEDSGGVPLASTGIGGYLRLVAEWLVAPADPLRLIALTRHPLASCGSDNPLSAIGRLDRRLRGPQTTDDFGKLANGLAALDSSIEPLIETLRQARSLWPKAERAEAADLIDAHLAAAEALAATASREGAARLWRGAEGDAASRLLADIRAQAPALGAIDPANYPEAFVQLISGASVRSADDAHPRLAILGPLEARLQSADIVILGGLNEGVWPSDPRIDAFLSRQMRESVGLPSLERRIGLSAHDFAQLAAAPRVVFTRARLSDGAPARPSRWIVRFKNILKGAGAEGAGDATAHLAALALAADRPARVVPVGSPAPRPPLAARPRRLSVTEIETLLRDPYSIYARRVLDLKPLDPLGEPLDRRRFGIVLHAVFEKFSVSGVDPDSAGARGHLDALLAAEAGRSGMDAAFLAPWRARLGAALAWFLRFEREAKRRGGLSFAETPGEATFAVGAGAFTLAVKTDRILVENGGATIYDYKSGSLPTLSQIEAAFNPQLPLSALILEKGGFAQVSAAAGDVAVRGFVYVKSLNRKEDGKDETRAEGDDARRIVAEAEAAFSRLIETYDDPDTPYLSQPRPQFLHKYGKFDVLARRREWAVEKDDEA